MLAYRSDLFDDPLLKKKFYLKYGVPLSPPQTWNEFNLIAKFFTWEFHDESPVEYGTCLTGAKPEGIMAEGYAEFGNLMLSKLKIQLL